MRGTSRTAFNGHNEMLIVVLSSLSHMSNGSLTYSVWWWIFGWSCANGSAPHPCCPDFVGSSGERSHVSRRAQSMYNLCKRLDVLVVRESSLKVKTTHWKLWNEIWLYNRLSLYCLYVLIVYSRCMLVDEAMFSHPLCLYWEYITRSVVRAISQ